MVLHGANSLDTETRAFFSPVLIIAARAVIHSMPAAAAS